MCGESWHAIKDSLTHCQAPVLKAGHLASYLFMCKCANCVVCVLGWRVGVEGDFSGLSFFFTTEKSSLPLLKQFSILQLVVIIKTSTTNENNHT